MVRGCEGAQPAVRDRQPGDASSPFDVRDVGRQPVGSELLERERNGDDPAVELGHGDLGGGVQGRDPFAARQPRLAGAGEAQRLQDRHPEVTQRTGVPGLVVPTGLGVRRPRAAGGEHRGDHDVGLPQLGQQTGVGVPQRGAPQRQRPPTGRDHLLTQRLYEGRVPAHLVRPVVENCHDGAGSRCSVTLQPAPGRRGLGLVEAVAGQQHRVGEEQRELTDVAGPAVRQVGVRLCGDPGRHRRQPHQLGVRRLLPREHDHRSRPRQQDLQALLPRTPTAEQPDDDQIGSLDQRRQSVRVEPGRVGIPPADRRVGRSGAHQVGVRGRQQEQQRRLSSSGSSPRAG